jgi:hypothetical protein
MDLKSQALIGMHMPGKTSSDARTPIRITSPTLEVTH